MSKELAGVKVTLDARVPSFKNHTLGTIEYHKKFFSLDSLFSGIIILSETAVLLPVSSTYRVYSIDNSPILTRSR